MAVRRPVPARVGRSFAFVDLCGFTDFADAHGDDQAAEVLHLLRACVREAATNHGVRVDKWLGDGAMVVGVDAPPLLAAVVELRWALAAEVPLGLRSGVAAGPVMVFDGDDYVGRPVNLAAKLCELAQPGQCLAPVELAAMCPTGVVSTAIGARAVPGFHEPLDLVSVDVGADDAGRHRQGLAVAVGRTVRLSSATTARRQRAVVATPDPGARRP